MHVFRHTNNNTKRPQSGFEPRTFFGNSTNHCTATPQQLRFSVFFLLPLLPEIISLYQLYSVFIIHIMMKPDFFFLLVPFQCWETAMRSALFTDSPWLTAPSSQRTLRANWSDLQQQMNHSYTCPSMSCRGTTHSFFPLSSLHETQCPLCFIKLFLFAEKKICCIFHTKDFEFLAMKYFF